jgi:hypothetical protein
MGIPLLNLWRHQRFVPFGETRVSQYHDDAAALSDSQPQTGHYLRTRTL